MLFWTKKTGHKLSKTCQKDIQEKMRMAQVPKVDIRPLWIWGYIQAIKLEIASRLNSFI